MLKSIFVEDIYNFPLIDARSESEYASGHIPGSVNIPLLNNEQRHLVGTCYKQKGKLSAVLLGYELVGPSFASIISKTLKEISVQPIVVYCWRGGMRSKILGELLANAGYEVYQLNGGYKSFRNWTTAQFSKTLKLKVIGGYTGSGKTDLLAQLAHNYQTIDLEQLAQHKGSAFGSLGYDVNITNEQFENNLALEISKLNLNEPVWIEDESRTIGNKVIPLTLWTQMRNSQLFFIDVDLNERVKRLSEEYGTFNKEDLEACTLKIKNKLGDLRTRESIDYLKQGNISAWIEHLLYYYDKQYTIGSGKRNANMIVKISKESFLKEFLLK